VNTSNTDYIEWFRHAAPYINQHRDKTFVVWFGGEAVACKNFPKIIHDINLLNSLGIKLVLVHGSRPQIEEELKSHGVTPKFHKQRRITDAESLNPVCKGSATARMRVESLLSMGVTNSPMQGASIKVSSGNYVSAKPIGIIDGIDHGQTGDVRSIHTEAVLELLNARHIVLLSNLAYSSTGDILNINSQHVAKACAINLCADKLIYFSEEQGLLNSSNDLLREIDTQYPPEKIAYSQRELFHAAKHACKNGVRRTHFVSHQTDGALIKELFTRDGSGSLISQQNYEKLRPATLNDIGGIQDLISPLEESKVLVKRSESTLSNQIESFTVLERDGHIIACAALHIYAAAKMAELACICVHPDYQKDKKGNLLITHLESIAKEKQLKELFVLTTQTPHWFIERGFQKGELTALPTDKQQRYNAERNSMIFTKSLS